MSVDGDDDRDAEFIPIADVFPEIAQTLTQ